MRSGSRGKIVRPPAGRGGGATAPAAEPLGRRGSQGGARSPPGGAVSSRPARSGPLQRVGREVAGPQPPLPSAESPPELSTEELQLFSRRYEEVGSLLEALDTGATALVKGSWLLKCADSGGALPRRQDMPVEGLWDVRELRGARIATRKMIRNIPIIALSYCWATPAHPDPDGEQLQRLKIVLQRILPVCQDLAVFIDWCSLFQKPFGDDAQRELFGEGLRNVNLWYTHQLTWVWRLTRVPQGVRPYDQRGWPFFERSVARLAKDADMVLDIGVEGLGACEHYQQLEALCLVSRGPPLVPRLFSSQLSSKVFTNNADHAFVGDKYRQTFTEVMASAGELIYSQLAWGNEELQHVAAALPWCKNLQHLYLGGNKITDVSELAHALASNQMLKTLGLGSNQIADISGLGRALVSNTALETLSLQCNRISDIAAFTRGLVKNTTLVTLRLQYNSFSDVQRQGLEHAWAERGKDPEALIL